MKLSTSRRVQCLRSRRTPTCMALKLVPSGDLTLDHLEGVDVELSNIKEIPIERVGALNLCCPSPRGNTVALWLWALR
mgnify:FL=1